MGIQIESKRKRKNNFLKGQEMQEENLKRNFKTEFKKKRN